MSLTTGRHEKITLAEKQIMSMLKELPDICKDFYYSTANYSHNTKMTYIRSVRNFLAVYQNENGLTVLTNSNIFQIAPTDINQYFTYIRTENGAISSSSIATKHSSLKTFFEFIKRQGHISENPMDKALSRPKVRQPESITYLESNEIQVLMNNIENGIGSRKAQKYQEKWRNRDRLIFMIFLSTGIRVSALDDINVDNIDIEKRKFKVIEKGYKEREFKLEDKVYQMLLSWISEREILLEKLDQQCNALFISKYQGEYKRITTQTIQNIVRKFTQGIDKRITPHKLRSTYGTMLYRATGDINLTAAALGHENPSVTAKRYAATDEGQMSAANRSIADSMFQSL